MTPPGIPPGTPPSTPMTSPSPMSGTRFRLDRLWRLDRCHVAGRRQCLDRLRLFGAGADGGGGGGGGGGDATNAIIVGSSGTGAVTTITVPTRIAPTTTPWTAIDTSTGAVRGRGA